MPCYAPTSAWLLHNVKTENGKNVLVFNFQAAQKFSHERMDLPCGRCIGCQLDRANDMSLRCVHEAYESPSKRNSFITLTFNPENLNESGSLQKSDFQLFMKRLRKRFIPTKAKRSKLSAQELLDGNYTDYIRYFHCGEYGKKGNRPHHHACLFNWRPDDLEVIKERTKKNDYELFTSEQLSDAWSIPITVEESRKHKLDNLWEENGKLHARLGFVTVGNVTSESAAYIARYIMQRQANGSSTAYTDIDRETGELHERMFEYCSCSTRPGLGKNWLTKYYKDAYPKNFLWVNGRKVRIPKYYDRLMEVIDNDLLLQVKQKRRHLLKSQANPDDREILNTKRIVKEAQIEALVREL